MKGETYALAVFKKNSQLCQFLKKKRKSISELLLGETIFATRKIKHVLSKYDIYLKVRKRRSRSEWMRVAASFPLLSLSPLLFMALRRTGVEIPASVSSVRLHVCIRSFMFFFFPSDKSVFLSSSHLETREEREWKRAVLIREASGNSPFMVHESFLRIVLFQLCFCDFGENHLPSPTCFV